jgi:hypothetical protein
VYSSGGSRLRIRITPLIVKKLELISGHAFWDHEKLFDEKAEDEKSRDTVLLTNDPVPEPKCWCRIRKKILIHNTATLLELLCQVQTSV